MLEKILTGPKIHYSELGPARPGDPNGLAWETYRREVSRLIADGHDHSASPSSHTLNCL